MELAEQRAVAGQKPGIEQRGADGRVLAALDQAIPDRPRRMADFQSEVPEEVQHVFDDTQRFRRRILGGQEQQVDVAERRQDAAAITAGRRDAEVFDEARVRLWWWCARTAPPTTPSISAPSSRAACSPVICSCSKACCTYDWMRARWRRKAPTAASRETAPLSSAMPARASESRDAAASGARGRGMGVNIALIVLCGPIRATRHERLKMI